MHNELQEVVLLFDAAGTQIQRDLSFDDFHSLVAQNASLPERSASVVKAAYAVVGAGLAVRGVVLFQCRVDEHGLVDSAFNLPLRYLVRHAGLGPELEMRPYRLACRSQCPVPWHSMHLWEPQGQGDAHPAKLVQKAVWRSGLDLKALPVGELREDDLELAPSATAPSASSALAAPADGGVLVEQLRDRDRQGPTIPLGPSATQAVAAAAMQAERARHEQRLTATFGEEGRLNISLLAQQHREQIQELGEKHRAELDEQQRNYLEQVRSCRDEIQKLKAALRNEQDRNRRLQGLLRGEV